MNGRFLTKHSAYMSLIMKLNVANKYGRLNYHPLAKPSPKLTHEEEQILFDSGSICFLSGTDAFNRLDLRSHGYKIF